MIIAHIMYICTRDCESENILNGYFSNTSAVNVFVSTLSRTENISLRFNTFFVLISKLWIKDTIKCRLIYMYLAFILTMYGNVSLSLVYHFEKLWQDYLFLSLTMLP